MGGGSELALTYTKVAWYICQYSTLNIGIHYLLAKDIMDINCSVPEGQKNISSG